MKDTTRTPHQPSPQARREVSVETLKVALEAVKMVYLANTVWLQIHGREQAYIDAMDELEAVSNG